MNLLGNNELERSRWRGNYDAGSAGPIRTPS